MKKILQALDKGKSTSVEDSSSMKQFMSIVTEGANPHKVSLPVQMAMDHYSHTAAVVQNKPSLFKQYVAEAEEAVVQKQTEQKQLMKQYARIIAERVQMKENYNSNLSPNSGFKPGDGPGLQNNEPTEDIDNPKDKVTMDIPLLIRLLEYAREDAKTDMDLHNVTEKLIDLSETGDVLTMDHYDAIVGEQKMLPSPTNESCWKDYKQVGMKKKGNKTVPNCVPKGKK